MTEEEIPYGYCHCGCGQKTKIAKKTRSKDGVFKGQPLRYINGHNTRNEFGNKNRNWKKGRIVFDANGLKYFMIRQPDHHRAHPNGYVIEHIVVAEKA